jgi:hypothetical protein
MSGTRRMKLGIFLPHTRQQFTPALCLAETQTEGPGVSFGYMLLSIASKGILFTFSFLVGGLGSLVVKALCYKPAGRGLQYPIRRFFF